MKLLIIGAGLQARAIAYDIVRNRKLQQLTIADVDARRAETLVRWLKTKKARAIGLDATDVGAVTDAAVGNDCVIGATTYAHNIGLTHACIAAGAHFCDLGGNVDTVRAQTALSNHAKSKNVTIIPDCGLAPGMANIVAYHWARELARVDALHIRVGGLPIKPKTALAYQLVFSVEGLINEYIEDCEILDKGRLRLVPGMSGVESLTFPRPFGKLEAFYTSGGTSSLPRTLQGHVANLDYKTIRYPGHAAHIGLLKDLGLFRSEPVTVNGGAVAPRALSAKLLAAYLPQGEPDAVLIRIVVGGKDQRGKRVARTYDCVDRYDAKTGLSAMQRTTGFPVAIIAQMLASGDVAARGTVPQELAIAGGPFLAALRARGIRFRARRT